MLCAYLETLENRRNCSSLTKRNFYDFSMLLKASIDCITN